ncbi:MAG: DegQ family serine endoprotease [Nitrospirae bacterium]|nr:DegQ family serine endoprotease [Nitrospirota bacterium]
MRVRQKAITIGFSLIIAGFIIGLVVSSSLDLQNKSSAQVREVSKESKDFLNQFTKALTEVSETVKPVVVNISTERSDSGERNPFGHFFNDPFFRKFFDDNEDSIGPMRKHKSTSLGSGVIIKSDGYIITNNHVVKDADKINVLTVDNKTYTGKVIGSDPKTDIAVIKIAANNLPTINIGDSDKLRVGEVVIAIGSPYGLNQTVTMGIVSAIGRSNVGISDYEDFIQTDAAINPGNSGGALVNTKGELVGINTAIFSTSGGYQGIGFAIPVNIVKRVVDSLIKTGKVVRGWLGISIQDLTPDLAKQFGIDGTTGVLIADIVEGGPAEKVGIKQGDLIVELNNKPMTSTKDLRNMIANTPPGNAVELVIVRDGKKKKFSVKVGELPDKIVASADGQSTNNLMGVSVQTLTPIIKERMDIPSKVKGVIVVDIDPESPAGSVLKQNDIICEVNKTRISDIEEFKKIATKLQQKNRILLLIYRGGAFLYVIIE